ncbi:MAG: hypothetical protein M1822_002370 [Bathelium mastoideum]|nr:MAG: hypothetical protein M1822_002370 [Bathelium mastoideum]
MPLVSRPEATLTCEQCRSRKTKCDKLAPCSACRKAGIACVPVQRARLPRGRSGVNSKQSGTLRDRVRRLESLVQRIESTPPESNSSSSANHRSKVERISSLDQPNPSQLGYVSGDFWSALSEEVAGIREILNDENSVLETIDEPVQASGGSTAQNIDLLVFSSGTLNLDLEQLPKFPKHIIEDFVLVFLRRIDPIQKIVHKPTLYRMLSSFVGAVYVHTCDYNIEALFSAILFITLSISDENELRQKYQIQKAEYVARYTLLTEMSLSKCGIMNTTNLTALQAFVIYLYGIRLGDNGRRTWTLIGCAVRIAKAQNLHLENMSGSPFDIEMRRRLWFTLVLLDVYTAMDRGTDTVTGGQNFSGIGPSNVPDDELCPLSTKTIPKNRQEFTEMSFSCMTHDLMRCHLELERTSKVPDPDWEQRRQLVNDTAARIQTNYVQYCDMTVPFQRFTTYCAADAIGTLNLLARRPLHRNIKRPPTDDTDILEVALEPLERAVFKYNDPTIMAWNWLTWVKWYALSIVLAELCGRTEGHLVARAWHIAEQAFELTGKNIADTSSGELWKPVTKLMQKALSVKVAAQAAKASLADEQPTRLGQTTVDLRVGILDASYANVSGPENWDPSTNDAKFQSSSAETLAEGAHRSEIADDAAWLNWQSFIEDFGTDDVRMPDWLSPSYPTTEKEEWNNW